MKFKISILLDDDEKFRQDMIGVIWKFKFDNYIFCLNTKISNDLKYFYDTGHVSR